MHVFSKDFDLISHLGESDSEAFILQNFDISYLNKQKTGETSHGLYY